MTRLTRVELRRLFARRLTLVGLVAVLGVSGVLLFAVWQEAQPLSAAEERQAQTQYERVHQDWVTHGQEQLEECGENWEQLPDPKPAPVDEFCGLAEPQRQDFGKPRTVFTDVMPDLLLGMSYLLAFAAFVVGASFIGAEFSSGAIGNWLTFEPRRLRVYAGKLVAAALGVVPAAVLVLGLVVAGTWLIVAQYGITAGTTGKVWGDLAGTGLRSVVLVGGAAALGGVVALVLRHTAAAIGAAMAYLVIVEAMFAGFVDSWQPWLLKVNLDAWIQHGARYYQNTCVTMPDGGYNCNGVERVLSFGHSASYLGVLAAVLVVGGALVFRRRDVS